MSIKIISLVLIIIAESAGYYFGYDVGYEKGVATDKDIVGVKQDDIITRGEEEWTQYKNNELGFALEYRVSLDGYTIIAT
jgi:hypothetical protein